MLRLVCSVGLFLTLPGDVRSADSLYVKKITDTLASPYFSGRGYVNNGMQKAANFIASEMAANGLKVSKQEFTYPANIFPGKMSLTVNGIALQPGRDFLVSASSGPLNAKGKLVAAGDDAWVNEKQRLSIKLVDKLTWTVAARQDDFAAFQVLKTTVSEPKSFSCQLDAEMIDKFAAANIMGVLPGITQPDSLMVFTAHYDHLGNMGKQTFFPGANDNAGGVAMLLELSKYYHLHPPPFTVVFIAFAGEEAGLIGSQYFTENPLVDLRNINFLLNLDLVGNGEEGITVVNATLFPEAFKTMTSINDEKHLLTAINSRGAAANSDHYWFTEKGVPSFFIYTLGKRKAYHDIDDVSSTLLWPEVNDLETLIVDFADSMMQ